MLTPNPSSRTQPEVDMKIELPDSTRFIQLAAVIEKTGVARSTMYELIAKGEFPQQMKISRRVYWVEAEIVAWMAEHMNGSRVPKRGEG
jgi:prophage regulatory protein